MDNGQKIAVKKLKYTTHDENSQKQFENECTNLMGVQHPYIVRLVGYCYETYHEYVNYDGKYVFGERNERALCFEYMEGRSLDKYISDKPSQLDWDKCFTIIKGVCKGLNHLHNHSILHLDIKPGNILLDNSMMPKIGDFGLSRLISSIKTSITTTPLGTRGYIPPEYVDKQEISPKFDVYSLGILVIHIMAGRELYNNKFDSPSKIIELVCGNWKNRLHGTMWSHASHEVMTCIKIALRCVKSDRHERPTMSEIVDDLHRLDNSKSLLTHEASKLQITEPLVYSPYTNSVSMGLHDNASGGFDSMEGVDYKGVVSGEAGGNDRSMHDPMDSLHESSHSIMRDQSSNVIDGLASRVISEPLDVTQTTEVKDQHNRMNSYIRIEGNLRNLVMMGKMDTIGDLFQWAKSYISSQWAGTQEKMLNDELFCLESALQRLMDTLPAMYDLIDRAEWRSHKHSVDELLPKLKDAVYDAEDLLDEYRWYILKVKVEGHGRKFSFMDFFNSAIQGCFVKVNDIHKRLKNISANLQNMVLHEVKRRFDKSIRPETSSFPNETEIFGRDMELKQIIEWLDISRSNQVQNVPRIENLPVLPIVGIGGVGKTTLAQHICSNAQVRSHFDMIIWVCVSDDFDVKRLTKEAIDSYPEKQATTENLNSLQNLLSQIVSSKKFLIVLDDMWDDALDGNGQHWNNFCAPLRNVLRGSKMLVTTRSSKVAHRVGTRDPILLEGLNDEVFWNLFKHYVFESGSYNDNDPELERIGRSILPKLKGSPLAAKTIGRILRMNLQAEYWNDILESEMWKLRQDETEILSALRLSYMYLPFHLKRCFSLCAVYPKDYKFQKVALAEIWVAEGFVEPQGEIPIQNIGCEYFDDLLDRSFFQVVQSRYVIHDLLHDMAQKVSEFDCFIIKKKSDFKSIPRNVRHLSILSSTDIDYSSLLGLCRFTKLRTLLCNNPLPNSLMTSWCSEFRRLRVIIFYSTHELPACIASLKHLRYFQLLGACSFKSLPEEFCSLYNLQIVCVQNCKVESLPTGLNKLICLQRFESDGFVCDSIFRRFQKKQIFFEFHGYPGVSLPNWSAPKNLASLMSPSFICFDELESSSVLRITDLIIDECENLSSLEHLIHPAYIPSLKKITITNCKNLVSLPAERFGDLHCLEELMVQGCPNIYLQSLVAPSLKRVVLDNQGILGSKDHTCGNLGNHVDCSSLTFFFLSSNYLTSIQLEKWNLPSLEVFHISRCQFLTSITGESGHVIGVTGGIRALTSLTSLTIESCYELSTIDNLLAREYLPAIQRIHVKACSKLVLLAGERFGSLSSLKELEISRCRGLSGTRGFVLPTSLQILSLVDCGDISALVPSCLQNLTSLVTLKIITCQGMTSIPGNLWSTDLTSLENLMIRYCKDIVYIGGENTISEIKNVSIGGCPKLADLRQPMVRGSYTTS
ncbi:unnamed protein product [Alopecurus aequalis]